ncbi:MAG: DNA translocase FtsK 4TM domain-containing protein, partial [Tsuneonella sp.]
MATRAIGKAPATDWRAAFRRSLRRASEMAGAAALIGLAVFLGLALASYTQTDPSASTAASGEDVRNWMGVSGAWIAERTLFLFGLTSVLLLPLLYVSARKLWRDIEEEDRDTETRWWMPLGFLLLAMALLSTVLALAFDGPGGSLPASMGGITGLLGKAAIEAVAARLPLGEWWTILASALAALAGGVALLTRVFALDWAQLLTLPQFLKRKPTLPPRLAEADIPFLPKRKDRARPKAEPVAEIAERRSPEIADPAAAPRPA